MATAAGRSGGPCRDTSGTGPASRRCAPQSRAVARRGVEALTLFAFSSENWARPEEEVTRLMELFVESIEREVDELHGNGIRIRFIGDLSALKPHLRDGIAAAEARTAANSRMTLYIAISYGGRWDILQAVRRLAARVATGELAPDAIDEQALSRELMLGGCAGPGPLHPHWRRAPHQQFPALEPRVHGALFLRLPVARFRRRRDRAGIPAFRCAPAPLRLDGRPGDEWLAACASGSSLRSRSLRS